MTNAIERVTSCCGADHPTPFCPMCGNKLREATVLDEVIVHFELCVKKYRTNITRLKHIHGSDQAAASKLRGAEQSLQKFQKFIDCLNELKEQLN